MMDSTASTFQVSLVDYQRPRLSEDEVRISVTEMKGDASDSLVQIALPYLAPRDQRLVTQLLDQQVLFEFRYQYRQQLLVYKNSCLRLRSLANRYHLTLCDASLRLCSTVLDILKQYLIELECEHRWNQGWAVGGYTYKLRHEIAAWGGFWFSRHKVWVMPNDSLTKKVRALLPGDF